jgi:hypothetical protein
VSQKACASAVKLSSFSCRQRPDETIFRSRRKHPETKGCVPGCQQNRDGQHAILFRSHLEPVTQQVPRRYGCAGGRAMIELSATILALVSVGIFAAHALDAYRTG